MTWQRLTLSSDGGVVSVVNASVLLKCQTNTRRHCRTTLHLGDARDTADTRGDVDHAVNLLHRMRVCLALGNDKRSEDDFTHRELLAGVVTTSCSDWSAERLLQLLRQHGAQKFVMGIQFVPFVLGGHTLDRLALHERLKKP